MKHRIHKLAKALPGGRVETACGVTSAGGGSYSRIPEVMAYVRNPGEAVSFFLVTLRETMVDCANCRRKITAASHPH